MPRGVRNPKPVQAEPEAPATEEASAPEQTPAERIAALEVVANDVNRHAHDRLIAMQQIARIRANG